MDTEVLNAIPDCKKCRWWYEPLGECKKPANIDCPKGVGPPQQEVAEMEYTTLG